jgi:hypothetical protein
MKKLLFYIALIGTEILNSSSVNAPTITCVSAEEFVKVRINNFTNSFSYYDEYFEKFKPAEAAPAEEVVSTNSPP